MLLDIPREDKLRLGRWIKGRREQLAKTDASFQIAPFLEGVCSRQTYARMCRGEEIKESEIYDRLLKKLHSAYLYEEERSLALRQKTKELLTALETKKEESREEIFASLRALAKPLRCYALEGALYEACVLLCQKTRTAKQRRDLFALCFLLDDTARELCSFYLLLEIYTYEAESYSMAEVQKLGLSSLCCHYALLLLWIRWEARYDAVVLCEQLQKESVETPWYSDVVSVKLFLYMQLQSNAFEAYAQEQLVWAKEHDMAGYYSICHSCGLFYYQRKEDAKAYRYLKRALAKIYVPEIFFLQHIATRNRKPLPSSLMKRQVHFSAEEAFYEPLHTYYQKKQKGTAVKELEDMLWPICRELIEKTYPSSVMKELLYDELSWLSEQSGDKRRLYQFNKQWNK